MSRRQNVPATVTAANPNPTAEVPSSPSTSESVTATRTLLARTGGQTSGTKGKPGDALYSDAGSTGSGLVAIATPEAFARHGQLMGLENGCRAADGKFASLRVSAAIAEFRALGNMVELVCDGAVATVGVLDPTRAAAIPKKTGIEWRDPLAYAQGVVHALESGTESERGLAGNVRRVANQFAQAAIQLRTLQAANAAAQEEVTQTRLGLRSYILDCKKFIHASTTKDHAARAHIKRKRPPAVSQGATTSASTSPLSPAPPQVNAINGSLLNGPAHP